MHNIKLSLRRRRGYLATAAGHPQVRKATLRVSHLLKCQDQVRSAIGRSTIESLRRRLNAVRGADRSDPVPSWPERKNGLPSHDKAKTVLVYVAHIRWWRQLRKRVNQHLTNRIKGEVRTDWSKETALNEGYASMNGTAIPLKDFGSMWYKTERFHQAYLGRVFYGGSVIAI